jgi:transposase-like protein
LDPNQRRKTMARKRYRPEEIIAKLREAEVLLAQGMKVPEVAKAIGIHEITYYRWRKEYGGLKVSQAKRLKELEKENLRLRKAVSDLSLDKVILQEAARGNF